MSNNVSTPAILNSKQLQRPLCLRVSNGVLYIADLKSQVYWTTNANLSDERLAVVPSTEIKLTNNYREPYFLFLGSDGVIYGTEHLNGCIFAHSNGNVSVLAGMPGYGAEGATTSSARFMNPRGGSIDPETDALWIADHGNDQMRCILPDLTVISVGTGRSRTQDGPFDSASFRRPSDLCYHSNGTFYIAESYAVRKLDTKSKMVSTLTGQLNEEGNRDGPSSIAMLGTLRSIALSSDLIFVTDVTCGKVRVIDMSGHVTTLKMPKTEELFGIAISSQGHALYTANTDGKIGFIPYVLDEYLTQPISMEHLAETDAFGVQPFGGEHLPLPVIQLAYPSLLSAPTNSLSTLDGDTELLKKFASYLLNNQERHLSAGELRTIVGILLKLGLPIPRLDQTSRNDTTHLMKCLSVLFAKYVDTSYESPFSKEIVLSPDFDVQLKGNFVLASLSGAEFLCHDWLLYARWPFFRNLLKTGMIESSSRRADLDSFEDATLKALIRFFYLNDLEPFCDPSIAVDLLRNAQRFNLADMSTPPLPSEPTFKQVLARCIHSLDMIPPEMISSILPAIIEFLPPGLVDRYGKTQS